MKRFGKSLFKTVVKFCYQRIFKKTISYSNPILGRSLMSTEETNEFIYKKLKSGDPFMAARYGGSENDVIASFIINRKLGTPISKSKFNYLCSLSGFFPNDIALLPKFVDVMEKSAEQADLLALWNWFLEDYIVDSFSPNASFTSLGSLEPWHSEIPWSMALEGKRVLVIHPFEESIKAQYLRREKLFPNSNVLPDFKLITLKAVQSLVDNKPAGYATWFDALESMISQIREIDFDIAIIGCGAYGFPLAAEVKRMNKQAIHLAGATQLLFGIKGKRWESGNYKPIYEKIFNEYWIRPLENEKPAKAENVEGACYW